MNTVQSIIETFIDNERVDTGELLRALERPEGREYLVDLLALRAIVDRQATPALVPPRRSAGSWRGLLAAAAMLLAVGGLTGYAIGNRSTPAPAAVVRSTAPAMPMSTPRVDTKQVAPPPPTTVIRLERGVDWTEPRGGI